MVVTCRGSGGKEVAKERERLTERDGATTDRGAGKKEACSLIRAKTVIK
jgi:hypothetical protein